MTFIPAARLFAVLFGFAAIAATLYFASAALGENGIIAQARLTTTKTSLEAELASLIEERDRMKNLNRGLSEGTLDLDLLDERVRTVLGHIRADEVIVP